MRLTVLDTETASLKGGVCDLAIVVLDENLNVLEQYESLIDPEVPISPEASAIHHIVDEMVWDKPTLAEFMELHGHPLMRDDLVVCGHNVQFDVRMLTSVLPEVFKSLCTLKLARNLWPDSPNHQLQTLRYAQKLEAGPPHRAMGDVVTCISLLRKVMTEQETDLQGLMALASKPLSLQTVMPFGKHKGTKLKDIPMSYVKWLLEKTDNLDPDLRAALATRA